jgi:hypothetical protein
VRNGCGLGCGERNGALEKVTYLRLPYNVHWHSYITQRLHKELIRRSMNVNEHWHFETSDISACNLNLKFTLWMETSAMHKHARTAQMARISYVDVSLTFVFSKPISIATGNIEQLQSCTRNGLIIQCSRGGRCSFQNQTAQVRLEEWLFH